MRSFAFASIMILILLIPVAFAQTPSTSSSSSSSFSEQRGPRAQAIFGDEQHYVTLTFYVDDPDAMQGLLEILEEHNVTSAVFFVDPAIRENASSVIDLAQQKDYDVHDWKNKAAFDSRFPPSKFEGITLSDRSVISRTTKMADLAALYSLALHSDNSSIIAFTPPPSYQQQSPPAGAAGNSTVSAGDLLSEILGAVYGGRTIVFTSEPVSNPVSMPINAPPPPAAENNSVVPAGSNAIGINTTSSIVVDSGSWNITSLQARYPADIRIISTHDGIAYLVNTTVILEKDAELDIDDSIVWIASPRPGDSDRRIEAQGNLTITDSQISSWDGIRAKQDDNPYDQRPFIFSDGGRLTIDNSSITHMGFLLGGFGEGRSPRAAIMVSDSHGFSVANSTLAFNLDALYARNSSGFSVAGNEIYGNSRSGIDIRSGSSNLTISDNKVHDNAYEGIECIECTRAAISGNVVEHNKEAGIKLILSNFSGVMDNDIKYNEKFGIFLRDNSTQNTLQSNSITESREGITLAGNSSNNLISENTLLHNDEAINADTSSQPNPQRNNRISD